MELNESLPNAEASERNVVGAILIDPQLLNTVRDELVPERFTVPSLRKIYSVMLG